MEELVCYAVVYLAEAWIALMYFGYIYERKSSTRWLTASFAVGYGLLFLVSRADIMVLNAISFCLVNTGILFLNYQCRPLSAILQAGVMTVVMNISEIQILVLLKSIVPDYSMNLSGMVALAVLSKLLYFLVMVLISRGLKPVRSTQRDTHIVLLLCVLPVASALVVLMASYIAVTIDIIPLIEILMAVGVLALLLANILVLVIHNRVQKMNEERLSAELALQREQADAAYYKMLQEQNENQRILIHDIRRHMQMIGGYAEKGACAEITAYTEQMLSEPSLQNAVRLCDEPALNMILVRHAEQCRLNEISFHCDVREGCTNMLGITDIAALFGNLLSNAVEAAAQSENRTVELSVRRRDEQGVVFIAVVNSCDTPPAVDENGSYQTRKADAKKHGIGLKSIQQVVKRCNGTLHMYYDAAEKCFHSVIQLPNN